MAKNSPDEGKNIKMVEKQAVEASMINLKEYRAKRQFGKTPEPMADTVETPNRMPVLLFRSMMPVIFISIFVWKWMEY